MELSLLFPKKTTVIINGQKLKLREGTLGYIAQVEEDFGVNIPELFEKRSLVNLCKIAACLLEKESYDIIKPVEVEKINPNTGEVYKSVVSGYMRIVALITTEADMMKLMEALLECFGLKLEKSDQTKKEGEPKK